MRKQNQSIPNQGKKVQSKAAKGRKGKTSITKKLKGVKLPTFRYFIICNKGGFTGWKMSVKYARENKLNANDFFICPTMGDLISSTFLQRLLDIPYSIIELDKTGKPIRKLEFKGN